MFKIKITTKNGNVLGHKKTVNIYINKLTCDKKVYYNMTLIGDGLAFDNTINILKDPLKNNYEATARVMFNALHKYLGYIERTGVNKPDLIIINHDLPEFMNIHSLDYLITHRSIKKEKVALAFAKVVAGYDHTGFRLLYANSDPAKYAKSIKIHEHLKSQLSKAIEDEKKRVP